MTRVCTTHASGADQGHDAWKVKRPHGTGDRWAVDDSSDGCLQRAFEFCKQ